MGAIIVFMGFILLFLLVFTFTPRAFMNGIYSGVAGVKDVVAPTSSTTTSTVSSTTSTTESTTTTESTSTTSTSTTSSTTSTSTSTTTLPGKRCSSDLDCRGTVLEYRCKLGRNTVYTYTTVFHCENRGQPDSQCVGGKAKEEPYEKCEDYQNCLNGACVNTYFNECNLRCSQNDYELYYCSDSCSADDVEVSIEGECQHGGGSKCCCVKQ